MRDDTEPIPALVLVLLLALLIVIGIYAEPETYRSKLKPGASALQHSAAAAWDREAEDERENGFRWAQSYDGDWYREWTRPGAEGQFERQWQARLPD